MSFQFEVFHRQGTRNHSTVRITKSGYMTLSRAAWEAIGSPCYVELLHSADRKTIGIRAADKKAPDSRFCNRRIKANDFLEFIGCPSVDQPLTLDAITQDGILVFHLPD